MAKAKIAGISTLGLKLGYAVEETPGEQPVSYTLLPRANSIGAIDLTAETLDASALEDFQTRSIAGREDTGGAWEISFNLTNETEPIYSAMLKAAAEGLAQNKRTWYEVWSPYLIKAFFVVAQPGGKIPLPEMGQNAVLIVSLTLALDEYIGLSDENVSEPQESP